MLKLGILDVEGTKYPLKIGREYFIGRQSNEFSHDIEIDNQSVDIKHSVIDLTQNSSPQLFDVFSKHGTYVDDVKIPRFKGIPLRKTSKIRFGNVVACLQLLFEGDSGFVDERLNSPNQDTSEIICTSPEPLVSSGSRLKSSLKNSLTSTPNQSTTTSLPVPSKSLDRFTIPSCLPRTSLGSNASARSSDSFFVPETQFQSEAGNSRTNDTRDISVNSNRSKKNSTAGDDDFYIPETQEVVRSHIPLSNHARLAFPSDDVDETLSEENRIPSSQFRMCTQDFNGSEEDLSNQSGDLLANAPLSMAIPVIKYDAVQVNDFGGDDEDDVEKEMSLLHWSRKTIEDADGSVTPDGLFDVVGSVTSDFVQVMRKSADKALSQSSTPDIFAILDAPETNEENVSEKTNKDPPITTTTINNNVENVTKEVSSEKIDVPEIESEYPPTQVFFKPISINKSITRTSLPLVEPDDDCDSLPETQVFVPPTATSVPVVPNALPKPQIIPTSDGDTASGSTSLSDSLKSHVFAMPKPSPKPRASLKPQPQPSPKPQTSPSTELSDDDDLPPTQAFLKDEHVPPPTTTNVFSSTLVDCEAPLSEQSFKMKFNKLLDSDDDEMDEVVAPDLVKQMRQKQNKPPTPEPVTEKTVTPENSSAKPSNQEQNSTTTPVNNNFRIPNKVAKNNSSKKSAVSIDNFMLTPDFLNKEISKNSQLQREAEVNWRNKVLEKRNKALFGDENGLNDEANVDSDDSQDSFVDLLPKRRTTRSKSVNKVVREEPKVEEEVVPARVTRRKSTVKANVKLNEDVDKKEPKRRGRKKTESNDSKQGNTSERDKSSKTEKSTSKQDKTKQKEKAMETEKSKDIKNDSKTKSSINSNDTKQSKDIKNDSKTKRSIISNDTKQSTDPNLGKNASLVKDSTREKSDLAKKSDLVKDSSVDKGEDVSRKSSSSKESSSNRKGSSRETKPTSMSKETLSTRRSSSASADASKKSKETTTEASNEPVLGRTRTRRKVQETKEKPEEKPSKPRAVKRTADEVKSSSKASKINKLDGLDVSSDKPSPRITRLKSASQSKVEEKQVKLNNNREKVKENIKGDEVAKKTSFSTKSNEVPIDLTESDAEETTVPKKTARKRKSEEEFVCPSQGSTDSQDSNRSLRRKKKIRIAMTSCSPGTRETLVRYSGRIWEYTEDPKECDVLILEAGNRTYKLLVAIARGVPVVKLDWLKAVIAQRSAEVSFDKHIFDDQNFETRHKFSMRNSLQMAKTCSLFKGMNFMMTPNITPKPDEMRDIIICAGGAIFDKIPTSRDDREFYLVSEYVDSQLWHRYRRVCQNLKIVTAISLMASVMQQSLEPLLKSVH